MADRVVEILLRLKTDSYKREALEAAQATERLKHGIDDTDDKLKKIPKDAAAASAAMKALGTETVGTGKYIQGLGDNSNALKVLNTRIKESEAEVRRLGEQFVRTGSVDVWEKLGKSEGQLRALTDMRKKLGDAIGLGAADGVKQFKDLFEGGLMAMPAEAKLALANVAGVLATTFAAAIGAAVNGALLAGVGLGGLALGIVGQIHDPTVQAAFQNLGSAVSRDFKDITKSFVAPLQSSAGIFMATWQANIPRLRADFEQLSRFLVPLASGLAEMFDRMGPGIDKAFAEAGPILLAFANELPGLGDALSRFFAQLADGGKGAEDGLKLLFLTIETLIVGIGGLIDGLSHLYEWFLAPGKAIYEWFTGTGDALQGFGYKLHGATIEAASFGDQATTAMYNTAAAADMLNAAFDRLFGEMMGLDHARLQAEAGLISLEKTIRQNGITLDETKEKGNQNAQAIIHQVQLYEKQREAAIRAGNGTLEATQAANAAYVQQIEGLRAVLRQMGFTEAAIDNLIGKYQSIPDININVNTYHHDYYSSSNSPIGPEERRYGPRGKAQGGPVQAGVPYTVGEYRPEVFVPDVNGRIVPSLSEFASRGGSSLSGFRSPAGGGWGPSTVTVHATFVDPVDGSVTRRQLVTAAANQGKTLATYLNVGER